MLVISPGVTVELPESFSDIVIKKVKEAPLFNGRLFSFS